MELHGPPRVHRPYQIDMCRVPTYLVLEGPAELPATRGGVQTSLGLATKDQVGRFRRGTCGDPLLMGSFLTQEKRPFYTAAR